MHLVVADRGHGDDIAAVGVADEHDRTGQGPPGTRPGRPRRQRDREAGWRTRWRGILGACRARSSASKPVASAQAPWTNTIVGRSAAIVVTAPLLTVCPMPRLYPGRRAQPRQANLRWGRCHWLLIDWHSGGRALAPSPGGCCVRTAPTCGCRAGVRPRPCRGLARDLPETVLRATSRRPTIQTQGGTTHLRGCLGTRGAAWRCEPLAHRWHARGHPLRFGDSTRPF